MIHTSLNDIAYYIWFVQNLSSACTICITELMWTLMLHSSCSQFPNRRHPTSCVPKPALLPQPCLIKSHLSFCVHVIIHLGSNIQLALRLASSVQNHDCFITRHPLLLLFWVRVTVRRVRPREWRVVRFVLERKFCSGFCCFRCKSCHSFTD